MTLLTMDKEQFRASYNRRPFIVDHRLVEHPLTQLDALKALASRLPEKNLVYRVGAKITDSFDVAAKAPASVAEVFDRIHEPGSAVQISTPEDDDAYRPLVDELIGDIRSHTEAVDPTMTYTAAYFFVAGPGCVTPYHMDREMNFLLHVRGPKVLSLWDPADPGVFSEADREKMFIEWWRPPYRPELESKAMRFDLKPGTGVHHPFIAPHAARTGDGPSVSMAITFRTKKSDSLRLLYRVNHRLRRLGLRPSPVGTAPRLDHVKLTLLHALERLRGRPAAPKEGMSRAPT